MVSRSGADTGVCGETNTVRLSRAALHYWEEPPISGESGSGTVFFSGCPLKCVYCQNAEISSGKIGREVSIKRLAEIFNEQQGRGALNINLVTPTHFVGQIIEALDIARERGLAIPVVYNTSGYETSDTIRMLNGYVDIFLTDFKYASSQLAQRYSRAKDYPERATEALDAMYDLVGNYTLGPDTRPPEFRTKRENAVMHSGIIVRHLMLPGNLDDSKRVIDILMSKPYARDICIALMSQYTPTGSLAKKYPELAGTVSEDEYDELIDYALDKGVRHSFMQEGKAASESFIPAFDYEGV